VDLFRFAIKQSDPEAVDAAIVNIPLVFGASSVDLAKISNVQPFDFTLCLFVHEAH
jgi:hypothetical protein